MYQGNPFHSRNPGNIRPTVSIDRRPVARVIVRGFPRSKKKRKKRNAINRIKVLKVPSKSINLFFPIFFFVDILPSFLLICLFKRETRGEGREEKEGEVTANNAGSNRGRSRKRIDFRSFLPGKGRPGGGEKGKAAFKFRDRRVAYIFCSLTFPEHSYLLCRFIELYQFAKRAVV